MKICIDPGHGGRDQGAASGGTREAVGVLPYSFAIAAALAERGQDVLFTRTENVDLAPHARNWKGADLRRRVSLADEWPADIFISVHMNAAAAEAANGAWVIFDDDTLSGDELARAIFDEFRKIPGLTDLDEPPEVYPDNSPWVGERELWVISETDMPAVLLELGFLTNRLDREQLAKMETKWTVARAVAHGCAKWASQR